MSQPLSFQKVVESLQRVLHDLHDLSEFRANRPFTGIVLDGVLLQYRDRGPSYWQISIQPAGVEEVEEVEEVDEIPEAEELLLEEDVFEDDDDEDEEPPLDRTLEEEFLEGFEEGRKGA